MSENAMPLQLKIISEHVSLVGSDRVREFHDSGGTIGRSIKSDWVLPDPDRFISGQHATIDFKAGVYYLADTSSNGVYVNDEVDPLGKGNPRRLFDGDRLRLGDFKISVSVDTGESLVVPPDEPPSVAPDHLEQFVDEVTLATGMEFLEEEELTGDDDFQSTLLYNDADDSLKDPKSEPRLVVVLSSPALKSPDKPVDVTAEDLFDSFLDGLGISRVELHPSIDRPEMLLTAGQVLRQFVDGTKALLSSRSNLKNTFRLDQTMALPSHNNPIKFSDNTNDLLKQLLVGSEGEYLGAQDSIREVCSDLINHQNAFLDAMNSAFIEFADRFEPEELQEGFDRTLGKKLFGLSNHAKYWELYCDLYPIITEKGGGRFPQMFSEEFVKAYERQITEYRRHDYDGTASTVISRTIDPLSDESPMSTQKVEPSEQSAEAAFDNDDVVDVLSHSSAMEIDRSFIDELESSLADGVPPTKA
jgi:type VI secretion system protein ImpI